MISIKQYDQQFSNILEGIETGYPYDSNAYVNYVKMNQARIKRWNRTGKILPDLEEVIKNLKGKHQWILITEPWCGDAAHAHPFIVKLAALNNNVDLVIQNRDAAGSEIDSYLTNGSKSIPILVIRDEEGNDLFTWGPRPKAAQEMVMQHKSDREADPEESKKALQKWYNSDKGKMIQSELLVLFNTKVNS